MRTPTECRSPDGTGPGGTPATTSEPAGATLTLHDARALIFRPTLPLDFLARAAAVVLAQGTQIERERAQQVVDAINAEQELVP